MPRIVKDTAPARKEDAEPRFFDVETNAVAEMHRKFGILVSDHPRKLTRRLMEERLTCLYEELRELEQASADGDIEGIADALVDLAVFAKGTAAMMGLPWASLFDDVMRANMSKVRGVGPRGHKVDLVKPPGWQGPNGAVIIALHGYNPDEPEVDHE